MLREIPHNIQEKRDLMLLRNELVYYLTGRPKVLVDNENVAEGSLVCPKIPDPINHHSACGKCPYNVICCAYLK